MSKLALKNQYNRNAVLICTSIVPTLLVVILCLPFAFAILFAPENSEYAFSIKQKVWTILLILPVLLGVPIGHWLAGSRAMDDIENNPAMLRKRTIIGHWLRYDTLAHFILVIIFIVLMLLAFLFMDNGQPMAMNVGIGALVLFVYMGIGQPLIWIFITLPISFLSGLIFRFMSMKRQYS